jgi:FKBP-type peptidyl-prolyl cis-trans isomerase
MLKIATLIILTIIVALILLLVFTTIRGDVNQTNENIGDTETELQEEIVGIEAEEFKTETIEEGTGEVSKNGDTLVVHYTGRLLDGTVFDSSVERGTPFEFVLGEGMVIQGWEEGMKGMQTGEKRILTIPSSMGYGETGSPPAIPGGAGLEFEVELLEIK